MTAATPRRRLARRLARELADLRARLHRFREGDPLVDPEDAAAAVEQAERLSDHLVTLDVPEDMWPDLADEPGG